MSQQAELQIQIAVLSALRADSALAVLLATSTADSPPAPAVYDHVPQPADPAARGPFPYVVVGEDSVVEFDTDTELGFEAIVTVHTYSVHKGRSEVKTIQGAIYGCLHRAELDVDGYDLVDCIYVDSLTVVEPDGVTRHGVSRFRITVQGTGPADSPDSP